MSADNWQVIWTALLPVLTLVLGYAGTLFTESRRDERERKRNALDRLEARTQVAEDRRREFELKYLLLADEAHRELGWACVNLKVNGASDRPLPERERAWIEVNNALAAATGYILEDEIRRLVEDFRQSAVDMERVKGSQEDVWVANKEVIRRGRLAREAIQSRVRAIYAESVTNS